MELSKPTLYIFISLYALEITLGVVGNVTTLIVLLFGKKCKNEIRLFLINLAVADLFMVILCLPFTLQNTITVEFTLPAFFCSAILFTQMLSVALSVFTNVSIGVERLLAVKYPFLHLRFTRCRRGLTLLAIWILSIAFSGTQLQISYVLTQNGTVYCDEKFPNLTADHVYAVCLLFILCILPSTSLMVLYGVISRHLWFRELPGAADDVRDKLQIKNSRKVLLCL